MRLVHASSFVDIGWSQLEILVATTINEGREMTDMRAKMTALGLISLVIIAFVCLVWFFMKRSQDYAAIAASMAPTTAEAFLHKLNVEYLKLLCDGTDCHYTDKNGNLNLLRCDQRSCRMPTSAAIF